MKTGKTDLTDHLSWQSVALLDRLVALGIYGLTRDEVAARFVDQALVLRTSPEELQSVLEKGTHEELQSVAKPRKAIK